MKKTLAIICIVLSSCQVQAPPEAPEITPGPIAKIDIHAHYRADRSYLKAMMDSLNLKPVLVDVARVDTTAWHKSRAGLKTVFETYPDYYYCAAFVANNIDDPNYSSKIINTLQQEIEGGARMVKVWKNFGMISKDASGNYVQIDDPRLQPIWDFLTEKGIPVMAHIGEPQQAWRPLEDDNPHANYYRNNPQYHAYQHPEIPSWETIQMARNHWLESNPNLVVLGAHHGSMSHDVELIGAHLDKYPNFFVEPAARFGDLIRQDSEKVRNFFIKHQDRILYGTDLGTSKNVEEMSDQEIKEEKAGIVNMMHMHWRYLSEHGALDYRTNFNSTGIATEALALPDSVLDKVYYQNAANLLKIKGNSAP